MSQKPKKEWVSVLSAFVVLLIFSLLMIVMVIYDVNNDKEIVYFGIFFSIIGTLWIVWTLYFLKLYQIPVCRRSEPDHDTLQIAKKEED